MPAKLKPRRLPRPTGVSVLLSVLQIAAIIAVVALGGSLVWLAPLTIPILVLVSNHVLGPYLGELSKLRPKLSLDVPGATAETSPVLTASAPRPWPVDDERIVADERWSAEQSLAIRHHGIAFDRLLGGDPLAPPPSKTAHAKAQDAFREALPAHDDSLRAWLQKYRVASRVHSEMFEIEVSVTNAAGAAFAEGVKVVVQLPDTVTLEDERPSMAGPPTTPFYSPPRRRSVHETLYRPAYRPSIASLIPDAVRRADDPKWTSLGGGAWEATVSDVHESRTLAVGGPLLLRACGAATHTVQWTIHSKTSRCSGEFRLVVPADPAGRPAFGRLDGLLAYPDVPITVEDVDDEGEKRTTTHEIRSADPPERPTRPVDEGGTPWEQIRASYADSAWSRLGLDPADDEARRARDDVDAA